MVFFVAIVMLVEFKNIIEFAQQMDSMIFCVPKLSPSSSLVDYGSILSALLEDSLNFLPWHIQILYGFNFINGFLFDSTALEPKWDGKKLAIANKVTPNKQYFGSSTIQNALPSFSWYCIVSIT